MDHTTIPLILDLPEWIAARPRSYAEVMEAWRTSCPRLTIWEDAKDRGFVVRRPSNGGPAFVDVRPLGRSFWEQSGREKS